MAQLITNTFFAVPLPQLLAGIGLTLVGFIGYAYHLTSNVNYRRF